MLPIPCLRPVQATSSEGGGSNPTGLARKCQKSNWVSTKVLSDGEGAAGRTRWEGMDLVPVFVPTDVPLRDFPGPQMALKPLV